MSYAGYRVKIGNTTIPNTLIASGTYTFTKERRLIRSWTDATGIEHYDYFSSTKVAINFSIRERDLSDHESISGIFVAQENLTVQYWDDYDCEYKTGLFKMKEPQMSHMKACGTEVMYNATEITLEEY